MEHNLDDSLNLDSSMGVDFENSDAAVSQADNEMQMEFEHIEEQPILMDADNEQIIDFMTENQLQMQEYSEQQHQESSVNIKPIELISQPVSVVEAQIENVSSVNTTSSISNQQQFITVKAASWPAKKEHVALASPPKEIAIAPKPAPGQKTVFIQGKQVTIQKSPVAHQLPIAPKPVTILPMGDKKGPAGVVKGGPIYARIGDKLVKMPGGSQKFKLVTPGGNAVQYITGESDLAQLKKVTIQPGAKTIQLSKISGQKSDHPPAVITKVLPLTTNKSPQTRIVTMTQKTVPISLSNASVVSPVKKILGKKDKLIAIKTTKSFTTTPKIVPVVSTSQAPTMRKVVITSNPPQNQVPSTNVLADGSVINIQGQSQIHQVNIPGKGVQYIKLMNPTPPAGKTVLQVKAPPAGVKIPLVITDSKGQVIHVSTDKLNVAAATGKTIQSPVIITSSTTSQVTTKPQTKFVRIAPMAKTATAVKAQPPRSSQSLLAPLTPMEEAAAPEEEAIEPLVLETSETEDVSQDDVTEVEEEVEIESKQSVRAFLEAKSPEGFRNTEVEVEFERQGSPGANETINSTDQMNSSNRSDDTPLIVIPSNYSSLKQQHNEHMDYSMQNTSLAESTINMEGHSFNLYSSPKSFPHPNADPELDLSRPRKPCNCTKSQCLKLYCDCFANGEFCNQCNCNNCLNNLENEELRQKAIRGTLERNPNAFRPKIGKAKIGGPEIRRHNKGCNCKRSGCLKNYCECFEAKIACTPICKCVGCRNVESLDIDRTRRVVFKEKEESLRRPGPEEISTQLPTSFMTGEVIEAVCQCLIAAATDTSPDPIRDVIEEFSKCLQDIVTASQQASLCEGPD